MPFVLQRPVNLAALNGNDAAEGGFTRPAIISIKVLLPQPDGPKSEMNWLWPISEINLIDGL